MNKMTVGEAFSKSINKDFNKVAAVIEQLAKLDKSDRELFVVLAALSDDDRNKLIDYWAGLLGNQYSVDQVKDYIPRGTRKQTEAALTSKDREVERSYNASLYGNSYAEDMTTDYKNGSAKQTVEATSYGKFLKEAGLSDKTAAALRGMDKAVALEILEVLASK